jgi:hypothetical protein
MQAFPRYHNVVNADVHSQLDNGYYFPLIELLEKFVHGHPNATFLLTFRSTDKWYESLTHWPPKPRNMDTRLKKLNITGSPSNEGESNPKEFSDWFCKHVERVRDLVAKNPSLHLLKLY